MFRLKKYHVHQLPKTIRRQFAPGPGMIEPAFPSRTKLIRVRVDRACLWSVCKTSSLAMCLIIIGAGMAVVGFYAPALSSHIVMNGNTTYTSMNDNAHWHLKNLTYVGPAFMGLGSVIIVAICVMTFEARDKAAKICPEDPPKKTKDELCVNVIKNLVRKYSGVPKVSPQVQEEQEDSRLLLPIYSANKVKRSSNLLETPVDYSLGVRCSSEPCVAARHLVDSTVQLPVVHVTSADYSPLQSAAASTGVRESSQPESTSLKTSAPAQQPASPDAGLIEDSMPNIAQHPTSGSSGGSTRRQSTVSRETVVDIHPLPSSSCGHGLPLPLDSPVPSAETGPHNMV